MKVYLSGKITGDTNYLEKFMDAQIRLEGEGHEVINPSMLSGVLPAGSSWGESMEVCLYGLIDLADAVVLLPDWKDSPGSCIELGYAWGSEQRLFEYDPKAEGALRIFQINKKD